MKVEKRSARRIMKYNIKINDLHKNYIGKQEINQITDDNYVEEIEVANSRIEKKIRFSKEGRIREITNNKIDLKEKENCKYYSYENFAGGDMISFRKEIYCFESFLLCPKNLWVKGNAIVYLLDDNTLNIVECYYTCINHENLRIIIIKYPFNFKLIFDLQWMLLRYEDCVNKIYYEVKENIKENM